MQQHYDMAPCFLITFDDNGIIHEVNRKTCDTLGYTPEDIVGKKIDNLFTIATRIFFQTHFYPLLRMQGYANEIFITLRSSTGEDIPVLLNAERLQDKNLALIAGIIVHNRIKYEDELIAAKKQAEKALDENIALNQLKQELQQHVQQLDKQIKIVHKQNNELRQFNKVVTHDLQEPLRKMSIFASKLVRDIEIIINNPNLEKLMRVVEQMRTTVAGLQQYIWLTDTETNTGFVQMENCFQHAQIKVQQAHPKIFFYINKEALPAITADEKQLQLLFYEILKNAIQFRKPDAAVHINISAELIQQNSYVNIRDRYKYESFIRLQIKDDGIGFDEDNKLNAFDLFSRLHATSGRGVGLALCKKVIDNHNGNIDIQGKKDEGATVTIVLPVKALKE